MASAASSGLNGLSCSGCRGRGRRGQRVHGRTPGSIERLHEHVTNSLAAAPDSSNGVAAAVVVVVVDGPDVVVDHDAVERRVVDQRGHRQTVFEVVGLIDPQTHSKCNSSDESSGDKIIFNFKLYSMYKYRSSCYHVNKNRIGKCRRIILNFPLPLLHVIVCKKSPTKVSRMPNFFNQSRFMT